MMSFSLNKSGRLTLDEESLTLDAVLSLVVQRDADAFESCSVDQSIADTLDAHEAMDGILRAHGVDPAWASDFTVEPLD